MSNTTKTLDAEQILALQQFEIALASLKKTGVLPKDTDVKLELPEGTAYTVPPEVVDLRKVIKRAPKGKTAPSLVNDFIKWFITTDEADLYSVKRGSWECVASTSKETAHVLKFHSAVTGQHDSSYIVCIRPFGSKIAIFNASAVTYGTSWSAQKRPQRVAEEAGAVPVPFLTVAAKPTGETVRRVGSITGAGCDLSKLQVHDWSGAEKMIIPPVGVTRWHGQQFNVIERHFAGAAVVSAEGQYFLFDADRHELLFHNFNPFFSQLPGKVKTVKEAYEALKPKEVRDAEAAGVKVHRQGEFFFAEATDAELKRIRQFIGNEAQLHGYIASSVNVSSLEQDAVSYGAAMINTHNAGTCWDIEQFIKTTQRNNGGKLDGSQVDAAKVLAPALERLSVEVGPMVSRLASLYQPGANKPVTPEDCSRYNYGDDGRWNALPGTLMTNIHQRLSTLNNRFGNATSVYSAAANVRFNSRIGQTQGPNDSTFRNNAHVATVVVQNPEDPREAYAIGCVIHSGRQHQHLFLDKWCRVYANTATNNWTVSGDVD